MAFTIKKLKMWKDPGYTEECVEVPPVGSWKLPAADWENVHTVEGVTQSYDLRPRKYATLTSIELPIAFSETWDMSYLYMEAEDTAGSIRLFGWIRTVERTATSEEAVRIAWVPDYWRTFSGELTFGRGTVTRTSDDTYARPYMTNPRTMTLKSRYDICDLFGSPNEFVIMATTTDGNNNVTGFEYYFGQPDNVIGTRRTPYITEIVSGYIDEVLGLVPSSIIGCWIVPPVFHYFVNSVEYNHNYTHDGTTEHIVCQKSTSLIVGATVTKTITNFYFPNKDIKTTDKQRYVAVNPYGTVESMLPWGFNLTRDVTIAADISVNGIEFYIYPTGNMPDTVDRGAFKHMTDGNYLKVTGLSMPIGSNGWSEYTYSGQREYERRTAQIQRNQKAVSGTLQSATSGTIAGALVGGGNPVTAVAGLAAGVTAGLIDTFTAEMYDDQLQEEKDKLYSNQTSNLLIPGGGIGFYAMGLSASYPYWAIIRLEADDAFIDEYDGQIANNGYTVEVPTDDCSAFLTSGPVQILNMQVTGEVMPAAKSAIKNKIANGVYIVENNPTGVLP